MESATVSFYLHKTPAELRAAGPVTFERILEELQAIHGARRAQDMGLVFLASELRDFLTEDAGGAAGDPAAAMLGLFRQLLDLYEGQRLAPPETFASYWQDVRAVIRRAEGAADG